MICAPAARYRPDRAALTRSIEVARGEVEGIETRLAGLTRARTIRLEKIKRWETKLAMLATVPTSDLMGCPA